VTVIRRAACKGEHNDQHRQGRQHRQRYRSAEAELSGAHANIERIGREELGRILRPAMRQHIDELEIGEGEDHRKQRHDQDDRLQQRDRDIAEALPAGGAVDCRRLV
jgi:hypothetical protein